MPQSVVRVGDELGCKNRTCLCFRFGETEAASTSRDLKPRVNESKQPDLVRRAKQ